MLTMTKKPTKHMQENAMTSQEGLTRYMHHDALGWLKIEGSEAIGLYGLTYSRKPTSTQWRDVKDPLLLEVEEQLVRYLNGQKITFEDLPLVMEEGTDFQKEVWQTLRRIPYGEVVPYQWIAEQIKRPKASRAVGNANGKTPLPLLCPATG